MSLLERSIPLLTEEGAEKLNNSSVAVFGVGGVGSWCAEALVRCGIGKITVIDGDTVSETNRNRQLIALDSTVGMEKATVCGERLKDINPSCEVEAINLFYSAETAEVTDSWTAPAVGGFCCCLFCWAAGATITALAAVSEEAWEDCIPG